MRLGRSCIVPICDRRDLDFLTFPGIESDDSLAYVLLFCR
jgi:hypothetical protein